MYRKFISAFAILFLALPLAFAQVSYNQYIFEGNKNFDKKNYVDSQNKFSEAAKLKPNDYTSQYNLGNAYYKQNKFEEAKVQYEKASKLAKNDADKMAALYNLGNAYMKSNQPEKAAEFYKQSLKKDPYNETIRKNYQIAMLKDKQNKNQQQNQSNNKGGKGNDSPKEDQKDKGKNQQNQGNNPQQNQQGEGDQPKSPKDDDELPKDLQDAILNRASNKERETARKILNKNSYSVPESNEKDW